MPEMPRPSNTHKRRYPQPSSPAIVASTASNIDVVSRPVFVFWREQ
jgi:hypothetical protein